MIISALLTAFMLASMAVGVVMRRRSPAVALALMLSSLAGIWFAWMPQQLTAVANALGVGRGTDLALYLWVSISILALAGLALQLRHLQGQLTILVREIAIQQHPLAAQDDDRTGNSIGVRGRSHDGFHGPAICLV